VTVVAGHVQYPRHAIARCSAPTRPGLCWLGLGLNHSCHCCRPARHLLHALLRLQLCSRQSHLRHAVLTHAVLCAGLSCRHMEWRLFWMGHATGICVLDYEERVICTLLHLAVLGLLVFEGCRRLIGGLAGLW
jgi:hypothetical protein